MLLINKQDPVRMCMIGQVEGYDTAMKNFAGKSMGQGGFSAARFAYHRPLFMGLNGQIDIFQYINAVNDDRNIGQLGQCCAHIKMNIYVDWDCNLGGKFENIPI